MKHTITGGRAFPMIKLSLEPGEAMLAHGATGDITAVEMDGTDDLLVQKDGYLAADSAIDISTKTQKLLQGFFGLIVKLSGHGLAFLSSYGAIETIDLKAGEEIIIDNGHLGRLARINGL